MHEYLKRFAIAEQKGLIDKGCITHINVDHDDWCGIHRNCECNCDPDVVIRTKQGRVQVLADGSIQSLN